MKPFRERNPVIIGAISLAVIVLLILAAFRAQDLPLIGGGDTYTAAFTESGGLKPDDPVRIAGVRVGKVEKIELDGDHVKVTFRVKTDSEFGTETGAAIRVNTLLGAMYLALEPAGSGQLEAGKEIPVERTSSPYDVVEAFSGLAETADQIDTDQLAKSLTTLADLTRNTPEEFKAALSGVSRLSANIADKNERIGLLLTNLQRVSTVLNDRDEDIIDADEGLRHAVPGAGGAARGGAQPAGVDVDAVRRELTALVRQSRDDLKPALTQLDDVVGILNKNEDNIDNSLRLMAPFYRVFTNTLGNGPWFDTYIQNMPPAPDLLPTGVGSDEQRVKQADPAARHPRAGRRGRVRDVPRRRDQDADRALPAHHLDLRGQRGQGARRRGRQRRQGDAVRHRRGRRDALRRRRRPPGRTRKAVIVAPSIVGDRYVQLTPVYEGGPKLADGATLADRGHLGAARARPDLLQPRRAQRRARPQRRQQERRAHRPARDHRRELRRPGRAVPPDHPGLQQPERRPSTTTRRSCSARPASSRASSTPWPPTTRRCGSSTSRCPASPTCSPASARSWPRRCTTCRSASVTSRRSSRRTATSSARTSQHINRVAKVLVKQRDALDETLHGRPGRAQQPGAHLQPAGRHPRHQRQPRRAGQPDRVRPGHAGLRLPQPGRQERPAVRPGRLGAQALGAVRHRVVVRRAVRPVARRPRGGGRVTALVTAAPGRACACSSASCSAAWSSPAATSTSTRCRCPAAPTSATTRSRSPCSSRTSSTWSRSRRSRSTTSASGR